MGEAFCFVVRKNLVFACKVGKTCTLGDMEHLDCSEIVQLIPPLNSSPVSALTPLDFTISEPGTRMLPLGGLHGGARSRAISPDAVGQSLNDQQSLNRYTYCQNNPLKYIDPTGHLSWKSSYRQ
jgi:hypothetical protein